MNHYIKEFKKLLTNIKDSIKLANKDKMKELLNLIEKNEM